MVQDVLPNTKFLTLASFKKYIYREKTFLFEPKLQIYTKDVSLNCEWGCIMK